MSFEDKKYTLPDLDEIIKKIDKGSYGQVYLVSHEGKVVARKEIKYDSKNEFNVESAIHEIELLKELKHRNIIEMVDSYIDPDKSLIYIYNKYYEKGDLWNIVNEKRKKNEDFSIFVYLIIRIFLIGNN